MYMYTCMYYHTCMCTCAFTYFINISIISLCPSLAAKCIGLNERKKDKCEKREREKDKCEKKRERV